MADNIFDLDGDLAIDFSSLELDMEALTLDRLLYQFQNSPVLLQLNVHLAAMEQESYDAALETLKGRTIAEAVGENLDAIGRIVGQPRILLNAANKVWFKPDDENGAGRMDVAPIFMTGAPLFGDLEADDFEFRRLILSKIFKNHVKAGSIPECQSFAKLLTGHDISFYREAPMDLTLLVPTEMTPNDVRTIITVYDDKTADRKYLMPLPATARLISIWYRPPSAFAPDRAAGRPDLAKLAIKVPISLF